MDSESHVSDRRTTITIEEPRDAKEKGIASGGAPVVVTSTKKGSKLRVRGGGGAKRGVAIFDLVLRLAAIAAGFAATSLMGTTDQTLPFFTQFFQFHAQYNDIPTFLFFMVANAVISGYLVLSLPISIFCIIRPKTAKARLLLIILDTLAMGLTVAAAASAATVLYLAHNGSSITNWNPFCQQFNNYCQQASSAVVASFVAIFMLVILIFLSAFALRP